MIVVGIDPSLTDTGYAVFDMSKQGADVLIDSGRIRTKAKEFFVIRYARHRKEIKKVIEKYQPDYVGIEKPQHNSSWSAGLYPIWISFAEICYENRISFVTFLPPQVKAFARDVLDDSGKMFKSDMVDAAVDLLGGRKVTSRMNHNIADAIVIGWLSWRLKQLIDEEIEEDELTSKEQYLLTRTVKRRQTGRIAKIGVLYKEGERHYDLTSSDYDHLYEDKDNE